VLQAAVLSFLGVRIESSIIGPSTRVTRGFGPQHAVRLSLGEGAEVVLS
jgi:glucose-1-phosphate thymidylyltransferase